MPTEILEIDQQKRMALAKQFSECERWLHFGGKGVVRPQNLVPGYSLLSTQHNGDALVVYRDGMLRYLAQTGGYDEVFAEMDRFVSTCQSAHPDPMRLAWQAHRHRADLYHDQQSNLFEVGVTPSLSHELCHLYQLKYEILETLEFLAHLCAINKTGTHDEGLGSLRDTRGRLVKGRAVEFVASGLGLYASLRTAFLNAYNPKLRNTIGHNEYRVSEDSVKSLDGTIEVPAKEFMRSLISLQIVQNAVLYQVSSHAIAPSVELSKYGIAAIGFDREHITDPPLLLVWQLAPLLNRGHRDQWLDRAQFVVRGTRLITRLGTAPEATGDVTEVLEWLSLVAKSGSVHCEFVPVMPCIHLQHDSVMTNWGEFCETGTSTECVVAAEVSESTDMG